MAKKLNQWKNTLSLEKIVQGMNAAASNAGRLLDDASALYELKRFPSSTSLAILSIEEAGKIPILRGLALVKDGAEVKSAWQSYRSHTKKNAAWTFLDAFENGSRKLTDFSKLYDDDSEHPQILDHVKQISFYTDCLGNAHWSIPDEIINEELARTIIESAKPLIPKRAFSLKEMQIWVKFMAPAYKGDLEKNKTALKDYFRAMVSEGLLSDEYDFESFLK
ncbi:AbiV family abortive infection protein [Pantoea dispersa]